MSEHSPRLDLPYVQPAQAQKHVTVNEAFERLDAISQLTVEAFNALTPPPAPAAGSIWALGVAPSGAWENQGDHLAIATQGGGWLFVLPQAGWRAYGITEAELRVFGSGGWSPMQVTRADMLGINTDPNSTNKLSVMSAATLLTHEGAGHQLKLNKAGLADTASVLFQTNWAGHAELGLNGSNDFSIKTSVDGSTWQTALSLDAATGTAQGTAVQSGPLDDTAGRLLRMGAFGLGSAAGLPNASFDMAMGSGFYAGFGGGHGAASVGDNPFPTHSGGVALSVSQADVSTSEMLQIAGAAVGGAAHLRARVAGNAATAWADIVTSATAGGPIADGGVVERTDTAGGSIIKYADGTQVCTIKRLELPFRSAGDCYGAWRFPAAFVDADAITVQASLIAPTDAGDPGTIASSATPGVDEILPPVIGALTPSGVGIATHRISGATNFVAGDALYVAVTATGRWK